MERMLGIEELLEEAGWLRRLAAGLVGDGAQAEDLLQDTWLAALRRPPSAAQAARPWLRRVVRNLASNAGRDRGRRAAREAAAHEERTTPDPGALAQEAEAQRVLAEAVTRLAEPLRAVIVLRYFQGLDSSAAAGRLDLPPSTVRTRQQRALEALRADLDRRFEGDRRGWGVLLAPLVRGASRGPGTGTGTVSGTVSPVAGGAWTLGSWPLLFAGASVVGALAIGARSALAPRGPGEREPRVVAEGRAGNASVPTQASATQAITATPVSGMDGREALAARVIETRAQESSSADLDTVTDRTLALAEVSGTILVEGRPPEWPLQLLLEPSLPAEPVSDSHAESHAREPGAPVKQALMKRRVQPLALTLFPEQRGAFSFGGLAPDWSGRLVVSDYALANGEPALVLEAPRSDLLLPLRAGPEIRGRIRAADGLPVAGLEGGYQLMVVDEGQADGTIRVRRFFCRADGRFRIPSAGFGEWATLTLWVENEEHGFLQHVSPRFAPAAGLELGELELEPPRKLALAVRDPSGAPIPDAFARLDGPYWTKRAPLTGADGSGELLLPERAVDVRVSAFAYADRVLRVEPRAALEVVLEPLAVLRVSLLGSLAGQTRGVRLSAERSAFRWDESDWDESAAFQLALGGTTPPVRRTPSTEAPRFTYEFQSPPDGGFELAGLTPELVLTLEALDAEGRVLALGTVLVSGDALGRESRAELALGTSTPEGDAPERRLRTALGSPSKAARGSRE